MIEVIIPAVRSPDRLLWSLAHQSRKPDLVTVVSNEPVEKTKELRMRVLGFKSDAYCYGEADVVLRRNIGLWESDADVVIFQDEDQFAPIDMVETAARRVIAEPIIWGHHRYIDFDAFSDWELLNLPAWKGEEREHPPNAAHMHYSCYAGMLVAQRDWLLDLGGFDMIFLGRMANEDQNLGYRALIAQNRSRVFIHEPPFSWHPRPQGKQRAITVTNSCGHHVFEPEQSGPVQVLACKKCPYRRLDRDQPVFHPNIIVPYDPALVRVTQR